MKYIILILSLLVVACSTEKVARIDSQEDCWGYIGQAIKYRKSKNYSEALKEIEKHNVCDLKAKSESRMSYFYHLGWTHYEMGQYREAISDFTEGLKTQPDYLYAYWRRGLAFEKLGELSKAKSDYARAYEIGMKNNPQKFFEAMEKNPEIKEKLMQK